MILGIGSDLVDIRRIERMISRFGGRFINRCFTEAEQEFCERRAARAAAYARRFAAKEACAKALGTGFAHGVFWRDIDIATRPGGQPTIRLTGGAAARLKAITPPGMQAAINVSMTDEWPLAQAIVIIHVLPLVGQGELVAHRVLG